MNVINYILFILLFLLIYSISFKTIEGFDDDFYYYDKLIDYKTIPNSYINDSTPSKTINKFGFYKGKGTFKKGYVSQSKSDDKISTLNKLLNKLLGNILNDEQDCIGEFSKYSKCNKSCGNAYQTRTYNVKQKRGKNGKACPHEDGYEEKKICNLDYCQLGDICEENADCESGNCDPNSTRCENDVPCSKENVHVCNKSECMNLNDKYKDDPHMLDGSYLYNNVDEQCFFKSKTEIEKLNLDIYTYNFRDIQQKLEDYVLDCKYYQIKKDGVGPCVNAPNIIMDDDGEPTCSPGFGPEPTPLNGSNACKNCMIPNESDGGYLDNDNCFCPTGQEYDSNNEENPCVSTGIEKGVTETVCQASDGGGYYLQIKKDNGGCDYCPPGQSFKKEDGQAQCLPCPEGKITLREYCKDNCSQSFATDSVEDEIQSQRCEDLCGGIISDELPAFNKLKPYINGLDGLDEGDLDEGDLDEGDLDEYNEICLSKLDTTNDTDCDGKWMIPSCVCSGLNEDGGIRKYPVDCRSNCKPGYYWDDSNNECRECGKLPTYMCSINDDNRECLDTPENITFNLRAFGARNYRFLKERSEWDADLEDSAVGDNMVVTGTWNNFHNMSEEGFQQDEDIPKVKYCSRANSENGYYINPNNPGTVEKCSVGIIDGTCSDCYNGQYLPTESVQCANCPQGTYNVTPNASECTPCPAGTYNNTEGNSSCILCDEGYYQNEEGKMDCKLCPSGSYSSVKGSTQCIDCPPGTYQDQEGQTGCKVKTHCWHKTNREGEWDATGLVGYFNDPKKDGKTSDSVCRAFPEGTVDTDGEGGVCTDGYLGKVRIGNKSRQYFCGEGSQSESGAYHCDTNPKTFQRYIGRYGGQWGGCDYSLPDEDLNWLPYSGWTKDNAQEMESRSFNDLTCNKFYNMDSAPETQTPGKHSSDKTILHNITKDCGGGEWNSGNCRQISTSMGFGQRNLCWEERFCVNDNKYCVNRQESKSFSDENGDDTEIGYIDGWGERNDEVTCADWTHSGWNHASNCNNKFRHDYSTNWDGTY